jgi:prophage regulatory protein
MNILRMPALSKKLGLSRSTIYLMISRDEFPAGLPLGKRARGWAEEWAEDFLAGRMALRDNPPPIPLQNPPDRRKPSAGTGQRKKRTAAQRAPRSHVQAPKAVKAVAPSPVGKLGIVSS